MRNLFPVLCILALSGCTSMLLGNGPSAGRPIGQDSRSSTALASDHQITAIVRNRFLADDELNATRLRVDTLRGVVTLRGSVDSYALRDRAARLAADVDGVVHVANQIGIQR